MTVVEERSHRQVRRRGIPRRRRATHSHAIVSNANYYLGHRDQNTAAPPGPVETPTPRSRLPQHLALVCNQFARLAARANVGVGTVSWRVVATIERLGPLRRRRDRRARAGLRPTATTVIKRLEERRAGTPRGGADRLRSSLVSTTEAGSAQLVAWREQLATGVGSLLEPLPTEDLATSRAPRDPRGPPRVHDR